MRLHLLILLSEFGWDTLEQRRAKQLAVTTYKVLNGLLPARLHDIFKNTSQIHYHYLSSSVHNLFIPRPLSEAGKRSFHYGGATLWNSLPTQTKNQTTLKNLCQQIKLFPFIIFFEITMYT